MSANDYTPAATSRTPGSDVSVMLDGDPVNHNALVEEATPGAKPYVTLTYLLRLLDGIATGVWKMSKFLVGASAPDPGSNGVGVQGTLTVNGASTLAAVTATSVTAASAKVTQTFERSESTPSASAATLTYAVTDGPVVWLDAHTVPCALTLASPAASSTKRYEVDIFWAPTTSTDDLTVKNGGGSTIGGLGDSGWIRFRWDGTAWRGFGGVNFAGGTFIQSA